MRTSRAASAIYQPMIWRDSIWVSDNRHAQGRSQTAYKLYAASSEPMKENNFCYVEIMKKISRDNENTPFVMSRSRKSHDNEKKT